MVVIVRARAPPESRLPVQNLYASWCRSCLDLKNWVLGWAKRSEEKEDDSASETTLESKTLVDGVGTRRLRFAVMAQEGLERSEERRVGKEC